MATPPSPVGGSCYQIDIVHVKPKYMLQYLQSIPAMLETGTKFGCKPMGAYMVEGGPAPEVVILNEWPSIDARSKAMEEALKSPEFIAAASQRAKFIYCNDSTLNMQVPIFTMSPPDPNQKLIMEKIEVNGFLPFGAMKLKETIDLWKERDPEGFCNPCGVLASQVGNHSLTMMIPVKNNSYDAVYKSIFGNLVHNPMNWPKLSEVHKILNLRSTRLLTPIKPENLPKPEDCKPS